MIKSVEELSLSGRTVFLRVDFNVPLENGVITDDTRILAALPTIRHCVAQNAKLVLASHLGRPKGKKKPEYSMAPCAVRLSELLGQQVIMGVDCIGDAVNAQKAALQPGQVLLLENVRFYKEEEANDEAFAQALAVGIEVFVDDAFGSLHRAHASVGAITGFVPEKGMGFLVKKEFENLGYLLKSPASPFLAILGGAKVSDKIKVIENLMARVDGFLIGGAMAYTFLKAQGVAVGGSLVEEDKLEMAAGLLKLAQEKGVTIHLPVDHVVASGPDGADKQVTEGVAIPAELKGFDIGPKTVAYYDAQIQAAKTVFWNGPMGMFEKADFANGTLEVARALTRNTGYTVVGGGDSAAALAEFGLADKVTHVSTGGGASLEYLEGRVLPGLAVLEQ